MPTDPSTPTHRLALSGYDVVRISCGAVLLAAAWLKSDDAADLAQGAAHRWLVAALVTFEFSVGVWLLTGLHPAATRRWVQCLFAAFAAVALWKAVGGDSSCGCFGTVVLNPWLMVAFDLSAVVAFARIQPDVSRTPRVGTHPARAAVVVASIVWIGMPLGMRVAPWDGRADAATAFPLRPEAWIGDRFPILEYIDVADRLARGEWKVVLYHHGCEACRKAIPQYEREAREHSEKSDGSAVALIEMPPYANPADRLAPESTACAVGRLSDAKRWIVATPAEIILRNGVVVSFSLPSSSGDRRQAEEKLAGRIR